ncbi:MAG: caspase family protein [Thermoanaerobaculia bacterium]
MSRKVALLIGNSTYGPGLPALEKPDADIAALAKVLADPAIGGFDEVKRVLDATSTTARREIARFFSGRSPDDLLLLYFSGHGLRNDRGALYLAVQDTEADLLRGTAVPASFISEEMDDCRSRRQILILDCCYSGAFEHGAKGPAVNPATAFTGNGLGRFVLTASDSTQLAWEDIAATSTGGLSVFTRHLVGGLESGEADLDGDGLISVDELYDYVHDRVVEENPRQTPGKSVSKQQGEIFLARNPAGPKLRPLPAELMQELQHPWAAVREVAVRELERFLRGSDAGLAKAARAAAEQARADDSRRVAKAATEVLAAVTPAEGEPPVPLATPAPEPQPVPAPKSNVWHPSTPGTSIPADEDSRLFAWLKSMMIWIALGSFVLIAVALLASKTTRDIAAPAREKTPEIFTGTPSPGPATVAKAPAKEQTPAMYAGTPLKQQNPAQALLTEAKSWPLVLADNFDSADTYTSFLKTELNGVGTAGTYTGLISSGVLRTSFIPNSKKGGINTDLANTPATIADFYLKVDVRNVPRSAEGDAGLVFRCSTAGTVRHYYEFMIGAKGFFLAVYTGRWHNLLPRTDSQAIHPGQTNSLAVVAIGHSLTFFINDQKVNQVFDATLSYGRVGLNIESRGIEPVTFDFDNFELRRRPEIPMSATPPAGK